MKYQPMKINAAQALLLSMGLDDLRLVSHHSERNKSNTKRGPGRMHRQGRELDSEGKPMPKSLKQLSAGSYGRGLRNQRERQNRDAIEARNARRMERAGVL